MNLRQFQLQQAKWSLLNFGLHPAWHPLLGVCEEAGELCHAVLKREQNIRTNEDHLKNAQDAVGDILIYLADFCTCMQFDMQDVLERTWKEVEKRDWTKERAAAAVSPSTPAPSALPPHAPTSDSQP